MQFTVPQAMEAAVAHHQAGRLAEAEALYRQVLAAAPHHADALHLLGVLASQCRQHAPALELIQQAIAISPASLNFQLNLGNVLLASGRRTEAIAAFHNELRLNPRSTIAYNNLAAALSQEGRAAEAVEHFRKAIALEPGYAEAHSNLGIELAKLGFIEESVASCAHAAEIAPQHPEVQYNLGAVQRQAGDKAAATAAYRSALALDPRHFKALNDLGAVLLESDEWTEAELCIRHALELAPDFSQAHNNLAGHLKDSGRIDEAVLHYRRALEHGAHGRDAEIIRCNLLVTLHYQEGITQAELRAEHERLAQFHSAAAPACPPHANLVDPARPLRLGMVSPHFASHPVGHFLVRLLENLSATECEVICYSDTTRSDALTARLCAGAAHWRETRSMNDAELAALVRRDAVDILFDLAGCTANNRLAMFAHKPAPVQVTWLDYVGTTGMPEMDYLLADPMEVPEGAENGYREKILRMPKDYICFDPPADTPAVGPLPALTSGHVTFGSFNIPAKTGPQVVTLWARILAQVPGARLLLKNRGFDNEAVRRHYHSLFEGHGIAAERVDLEGWCPREELLAAYGRVDIGLDTLPYNGGLTTCESLWMGVPVVTCPGERFAGRHGLTHLTAAGMPAMIARDHAHYVELAVALTRDLEALALMRSRMRERIATSPLCDGAQFARDFEKNMRGAWRSWCAQQPQGFISA